MLTQNGGSLQVGTLNVGNGVYDLQGGGSLSNTNIRTGENGGLVIQQGRVSDSSITGSLTLEGADAGDAVLRDGNCVHTGTANLTDHVRPMLDRTYHRVD